MKLNLTFNIYFQKNLINTINYNLIICNYIELFYNKIFQYNIMVKNTKLKISNCSLLTYVIICIVVVLLLILLYVNRAENFQSCPTFNQYLSEDVKKCNENCIIFSTDSECEKIYNKDINLELDFDPDVFKRCLTNLKCDSDTPCIPIIPSMREPYPGAGCSDRDAKYKSDWLTYNNPYTPSQCNKACLKLEQNGKGDKKYRFYTVSNQKNCKCHGEYEDNPDECPTDKHLAHRGYKINRMLHDYLGNYKDSNNKSYIIELDHWIIDGVKYSIVNNTLKTGGTYDPYPDNDNNYVFILTEGSVILYNDNDTDKKYKQILFVYQDIAKTKLVVWEYDSFNLKELNNTFTNNFENNTVSSMPKNINGLNYYTLLTKD
jgi:hypothetical protein